MENQQPVSLFNLLSGRASFTNEPLWYRLVVISFTFAFWVFVVLMTKEIGLIAMLSKGVIGKWGDILGIVKDRSP